MRPRHTTARRLQGTNRAKSFCEGHRLQRGTTLKRMTTRSANSLVTFERKVADAKLYGQPLDYEGAVRELALPREP